MSTSARVVNTAPLVFLAKLDRLELLRLGVDVVYVPTPVLSELRFYQDESTQLISSVLNSWLEEKNCSRGDLLTSTSQALDAGEAAVIALA